jgi:hypothetical protein
MGGFGAARRLLAGNRNETEVGTFGDMAPEQAYGRTCAASDVFSLALTAYEAFAGVLPGWPFEWPLEGARRFERRCPEPVARVLERGLRPDLTRRFTDGVELDRALRRAVERAGGRAIVSIGGDPQPRAADRKPRSASVPDPFTAERDWFLHRYGRLFETDFDCHACEGPISEAMRRCPWCGTDRNSFATVTAHPLVCPDCDRGVRSEWSACPTCTTGRFESDGEPLPPASKHGRRCTRKGCGAPIERFMHYCPRCKARVARPWKVEGLGRCDRCRWPQVDRWRFCPWCGRRNDRAMAVGRARR